MIVHAETYQKDQRLHYVSAARMQEELEAVGVPSVHPRAIPETEGRPKPAQKDRA